MKKKLIAVKFVGCERIVYFADKLALNDYKGIRGLIIETINDRKVKKL